MTLRTFDSFCRSCSSSDFELQYSFDSSDNIWIKSVGFR